MNRPRPVPCLFRPSISFATNLPKSLGRISVGIPFPSLLTLISSLSESFNFEQLTVMLPACVNLMALSNMFENACLNLSVSPLKIHLQGINLRLWTHLEGLEVKDSG